LQIIEPAHSGTSCVFLTIWQVPVPQLWQGALHMLPQQTPSVQKPDEHSAEPLQSSPFALLPAVGGLPQAPAPLQVVPLVHSSSGSVPWG
jgi:hypothetical protein